MKLNIDAYFRLARLDKPVGIWLLLIPCWFGLALAQTEKYWLYPLFAAGAVIMRSAGCIINDIADRKLDAKVERTKNRPLASGEVKLFEALAILAVLLSLGLAILLLLPKVSIYIGFLVMPFVAIYPLMKRFTYYPQVMLGLVFNIGVLMAYAAATGNINFAAALLYFGCVCWTLGYDTIYAMQDKADDAAAGIKSTALKFGNNTQKIVPLCYAVFAGSCLVSLSFSYLSIILWIAATAQLCWQIYALNKTNNLYWQLFKSNTYVGLLLVAALLI